MKVHRFSALALVLVSGFASLAHATKPSLDEFARDAFKEILAEADKNKDGKLSLTECKAMWKDAAKGEKNCTFWDVNHDGTITENEYVSQAKTFRGKGPGN